jgi:beta-carotene hydroxylase
MNADAYMQQTASSRFGVEPAAWPLVALFFTLISAAFLIAVLALAGIMPFWAAAICNVAVLYLIAHINHEAVHRNISGAETNLKWLNDLIGHFGSFWLFLPFPAFKTVHLAHHRLTNHPTLDGDMWLARKSLLGVFLSCCTFLFGYETRLRRLHQAGLVETNVMVVTFAQRMAALALVAAAFALGWGYEVFMLWVLPALVAMPILAFMFAFAVHRPHSSREPLIASNVLLAPGPLQALLTAVFVFQNYHLVHHLHPRIPFYRYGDAFRQLRPKLEAEGAAIRRVF